MVDTYLLDWLQSNKVQKYLYNNFYSKCKSCEIVKDKKRQLKGIDVIINDEYFIDEKSTEFKGPEHIHSYFLELTVTDKNGIEREGWAVKDNDTTHYLITWYKKDRQGNIYYSDHILISSEAIKRFVWLFNNKDELILPEDIKEAQKLKLSQGPAPENSKLIIVPEWLLRKYAEYTFKINDNILNDIVFNGGK